MNLKLIKYTNANALEATWFNRTITPAVGVDGEEGYRPEVVTDTQVRCHAYADTQMQMLRDDAAVMGTPLGDYEDLIASVEANIKPAPPVPLLILSCSPWQMRKKLNKEGLRQTVEDYVALPDTPIEIKDGWLYATEFREDDPFVQQMAVMLQVEDLHAFIEDALTI